MTFKALRTFRDDSGKRFSRMVDVAVEDLSPGEVVLRSQFAAVNYKDARAVTGQGNVLKRFPSIAGIEVSGVVESSADARFRSGDLVTVQGGRDFGMGADGAFSEFVRVPADWVAKVPEAFDAFSVVATGIAGYTAAVAVEAIERHGLQPANGEIIVTGATGGCSSLAINMLAGLGYSVVGMTGKASEHRYLQQIGCTRVVGREVMAKHPKALDEQLWAGCIDAVGGAPLDFVLRTMRQRGVVAAFGNAAGEKFSTSIYPFILRSVVLAGVNANHPVGARGSAWSRMTGDLRPRALDKIVHRIGFDDLLSHCEALVQGAVRGRAVVCFG